MNKKRGQASGSGAATLIGIMTLILIFYILFLPAEEREELLEDEVEDDIVEQAKRLNITLLEEEDLRLEHVGDMQYEHDIPNVYLFEKTGAEELESTNPFSVRRGWFKKEFKALEFDIEDLENTDNVVVSFNAEEHEGNLRIILNDKLVYDYEITKFNIDPIELKKEFLKEEGNTLKFEVSGVGMRFWAVNEYSLENVKILGDVRETAEQESRNIFTITNTEYYNLKEATLRFFPVCDVREVGKLDITLNRMNVYSAVPRCGKINEQDLFTEDFNPGKNVLIFSTDKGSYRVDRIAIKTRLEDVKDYLEYFEVNETVYDAVADGGVKVELQINFIAPDDSDKEADINVNGHLTHLDQKDEEYTRDISNWVEEGTTNYIEIKPETTLRIEEIKVMVVDA